MLVCKLEEKNSRTHQDLIIFDLKSKVAATNNFSTSNKLGEGGFDRVYKGVLANGQEVAVKRLSKNSGKGLEQFKNEVMLIAKLQHRNLMRLFGCCTDAEEKMLIYECLANKSLDFFIFGSVLPRWIALFGVPFFGSVKRELGYTKKKEERHFSDVITLAV